MWIRSCREIISRFPWRDDGVDGDDVLPPALQHVFTLVSARLPGRSCGRSSKTALQFKRNHFIPDIHKAHCGDELVFVVPGGWLRQSRLLLFTCCDLYNANEHVKQTICKRHWWPSVWLKSNCSSCLLSWIKEYSCTPCRVFFSSLFSL